MVPDSFPSFDSPEAAMRAIRACVVAADGEPSIKTFAALRDAAHGALWICCSSCGAFYPDNHAADCIECQLRPNNEEQN